MHDGLGSLPFARRYLGDRCFFPFLCLLRCFSSAAYLPYVMDWRMDAWSLSMRVSPFGDLRIDGYLRLPEAFRSLSRPSSALSAKASALRPSCLIPYMYCSVSSYMPAPPSAPADDEGFLSQSTFWLFLWMSYNSVFKVHTNGCDGKPMVIDMLACSISIRFSGIGIYANDRVSFGHEVRSMSWQNLSLSASGLK